MQLAAALERVPGNRIPQEPGPRSRVKQEPARSIAFQAEQNRLLAARKWAVKVQRRSKLALVAAWLAAALERATGNRTLQLELGPRSAVEQELT